MWPLSRPSTQRPGFLRAVVGVLSVAAILLPAVGIAYLGSVSYRDDRGLVAAKLDQQFDTAAAVARSLETELEATLDQVAVVLDSGATGLDVRTGTDSDALDRLRGDRPLAAFPFRVTGSGELGFPALEPLRSPIISAGDFLSRAPRTCPERAFDACIREIREARRRARRLDVAHRRELGDCADGAPGSGGGTAIRAAERCRTRPRDRELARRAYVALAGFEDTGPAALLGLARMALADSDRVEAVARYRVLQRRFGSRLDNDGVSYRLLGDLGIADASGEPGDRLAVLRRLAGREYQAPSAALSQIAEQVAAHLKSTSLDDRAAAERDRLQARIEFAHHQARVARALVGEVEEIVRTAGPQIRGRPTLSAGISARRTTPGGSRTLLYRREADRSIIGVLVDIPMLEAAALRLEGRRLAPGVRVVIERPGDSARRAKSLRTLASTGFGPILPHLSLTLVNDRRLPDPLDEIVAARGRRHLAITGGLVALLLIGLFATIRGAARERELARLKSDFVSTVSHELKTPLTSIRMFGEMLQQDVAGRDREREARYHDIIVKESQRLGLLIANLLDYSQIERGTRRYSSQAEIVADLARDAIATFQRFRDVPADIRLIVGRTSSASSSGFDADGDGKGEPDAASDGDGKGDAAGEGDRDPDPAEPAEHVLILADREVVVQCLLNLLGNALKYGEPPIVVRVAVTESGAGDRVTLSVSDRGPGIAKSEQERIFREFYRTQSAYSSGVEGTGLGLALVKRHIEAQGGEVSVRSEPGHGATFSITFATY